MDKDFDDFFDGTEQEPTRLSRFAPKGSKLQPHPSSASASLPLPASGKESADEIGPEQGRIAVDFDVEVNPGVEKVQVQDNLREMEAAEVHDEVVREMDVYFDPSIDPKTRLYLFQYPLRPQWRHYDLDDRCEEVRVKPTTSEVEVDLTVDVESDNYDNDADPSLHMKKAIIATTWKPPPISGLTLAVRTENKIHLNLVHSFVQLRPSMRHLNRNKASIKEPVGENSAEDGWVPLKYHGESSALVKEYLENLRKGAGPEISFSMSSHKYLNTLCPGTGDSLGSQIPPRRSLLALPLKERFEKWLLEGPPFHRFHTLVSLAPDDSIEDVLTVLQDIALLVQGLWIVRTSLKYEERAGVKPMARDYALLLFTKDAIIKESQLPKNHNLAGEIKVVLQEVARYRPIFKDWKLKEAPDLDFINRYPTVVMDQQKQWESAEKQINNMFGSLSGRNGPGTKNVKSSTPSQHVASKDPDKLAAETSSGPMPRKDTSEVREAIKKALQKIFKSTKTCSSEQISQRLRDITVSENTRMKGFTNVDMVAAKSIDEFPDELQTILNEFAVNIHGIYVPKSSPDNPEYDDLRGVVIGLLASDGPHAKLKKGLIFEAATLKLGKQPTQAAYQKVMQEICVYEGTSWSLKKPTA